MWPFKKKLSKYEQFKIDLHKIKGEERLTDLALELLRQHGKHEAASFIIIERESRRITKQEIIDICKLEGVEIQ